MPGRRHIRAVIFDMDGVLTDSEPLINAAAIAMFQEKGLAVEPADFLPFCEAVGCGAESDCAGLEACSKIAPTIIKKKKGAVFILIPLALPDEW